ncbi:protein of unknown function DUF1667 [Kipferlia bialata]|uniref:FAD dependent oxidoreductase n=1 Tax=Kipferlia bialata TaxID=797122 RepID=A0A9K3GHU0_9EUKA|nr:protein of unknown function DUF1667 [Kipferlia bialata]|eukprot:g4040.t1
MLSSFSYKDEMEKDRGGTPRGSMRPAPPSRDHTPRGSAYPSQAPSRAGSPGPQRPPPPAFIPPRPLYQSSLPLSQQQMGWLVSQLPCPIEGMAQHGTDIANRGADMVVERSDPSTVKGSLVVRGNQMLVELAKTLNVGYKAVGELVVASSPEELVDLRKIYEQGLAKGIELEWWDAERMYAEEPHLAPGLVGAINAPTAGVINPYELVYKSAACAVLNGCHLATATKFLSASLVPGSDGQRLVHTDKGDYWCRYLVNSAGLYADDVARGTEGVEGAEGWEIRPRKGEEYVLDRSVATRCPSRIIFPMPDPVTKTKGTLLIPTVDGTWLAGPTADMVTDKTDTATSNEGLKKVFGLVRNLCDKVGPWDIISSFAGLRPAAYRLDDKPGTNDFIIERHGTAVLAAGIQSPGLTACPAIAERVIALLTEGGLDTATPKAGFQPALHGGAEGGISRLSDLTEEQQRSRAAADPRYTKVVCQCEGVTEGDIHRAIDLGAKSLDGVKFLTRARMGPCQGGFCTEGIMGILAERLNIGLDKVSKMGADSVLSVGEIGTHIEAPVPVEAKIAATELEGQADAQSTLDSLFDTPIDTVVVGGGAAGLSAAVALKKQGVERVVVLDRNTAGGGVLLQCIHAGFGLRRYKEELTGPEYAERLSAECRESGSEVYYEAFILDIAHEEGVETPFSLSCVFGGKGIATLKCRSVVYTAGCRERTRHTIRIPGTRPSGVYTAGLAQKLINSGGQLVGRKVVILGSGDIGLIMARRSALEGAEVVGVYELLGRCSGLERNKVQCLDDFNIPLTVSSTVTHIYGHPHITAVDISPVDPETLRPDLTKAKRVECDALMLSVGLTPETSLLNTMQVTMHPRTRGPCVDSQLMSLDVEGLFVAGNALQIHDLADAAAEEAERAGKSCASYLKAKVAGTVPAREGMLSVETGEGVIYAVPNRVIPSALARVSFRVRKPMSNCLLTVSAHTPEGEGESEPVVVGQRTVPHAVPGEMETVILAPKKMAGLSPSAVLKVSAVEQPDATPAEPLPEGHTRVVRTCVRCPRGCRVTVVSSGPDIEDIVSIRGNSCPKGRAFVIQEHVLPLRVFSSAVPVVGGTETRCPVKLSKGIPTSSFQAVIDSIHAVPPLTAPVSVGDVIVTDVAGCEGVDVLATRNIPVQ